MRRRAPSAAVAAILGAALLAGCAGDPETGDVSTAPSSPAGSAGPSTGPDSSPSASASPSSKQSVEGTVVRFTAGNASVDVTIGQDSPASRDFVSMLPMTLELEDLNTKEKIAYLPRELRWDGSPGSDPEDGDLIYYSPWGNIGFYYDASGIDYSDQTLHLGTYHATEAELARFEGQRTRVQVVQQ
jgi:hypothetical protein